MARCSLLGYFFGNCNCSCHCYLFSDKTLVPKYAEAVQKISATLEDTEGPIRSHVPDDEPKHEKVAETSSSGKPIYPPLPEEPKGSRELLCRVGIRLPDGRRLQRNFLRKDPVKVEESPKAHEVILSCAYNRLLIILYYICAVFVVLLLL